ncbi:hypothetical protein [Massilia sp. Leaf139]|uniref:hypothetical protein n=1 Tax=Massilia sp. Leaf139 TaxID=1736272 RepID=UPI0006F9CD49|nr:hypothetical protein [Massilia sp. Leaf139]KQQ94970.1 hypothetical protein ASF77_22235 [Massilia sp. Leaf139]
MTAAAIRAPRRALRKLLKPLALLLTTIRLEQSELELTRLQILRADLAEAEGAMHLHQVRLMQDRRAVEGW